jgi:hypothetical protein
MNSKIGPILIGLSYLGLVVFIMIFCAKQSSDFAGYSQYWGLFGTLVGVATGAIPSFFFKSQADDAKKQADSAKANAAKETTKAQLYAAVADPQAAAQVQTNHPDLFA